MASPTQTDVVEDDHSSKYGSSRAVGAGFWVVSGRLVGKLIDFGLLLLLARLLTPDDFGLIAKALVFVVLLEAITDVPLQQPLYRSEFVGKPEYDTAYTLGLIRGLLVGIITCSLAPIAASAYSDSRLLTVLAALGAAPILRGLVNPRLADFVRDHNLRPEFLINIVSKASAAGIAAVLAAATGSYWAIVAGSVASVAMRVFLSYTWRPYRPHLSLAAWPDFRDIVGWSAGYQIAGALNFQIDRLVLGRFLPTSRFGEYSIASDVTGIPFQAIVFPLAPTLTRVFAGSNTSIRTEYLWSSISNALLVTVGGSLIGLAVLSDEMVGLLLGPQWAGVGSLIAVMAVAAIPDLLNHTFTPFAIANYETRRIFIRSCVALATKGPFTIWGFFTYGALGAAGARGVGAIFALSYVYHSLTKVSGLNWKTEGAALLRSIASLMALAVGCQSGLFLMGSSAADESVSGRIVRIAVCLGFGLSAQLCTLVGLWFISGKPKGLEHALISGLAARRAGNAGRLKGEVEPTPDGIA